jgi:WD40 repeat protein
MPSGLAPDGAISLAYSADGKYLAVGTRSGQVHCWDLAHNPPKIVSWQAAMERIHEIIFHPDRPVLYAASFPDRFVKRWDVATGKELARLELAEGTSIHGMSLHKDGKVLACTVDGKISFFDADSFSDLNKTHSDYVGKSLGLFGLRYSPDGRFLAVLADDGILILLDPDGIEVRRFTLPGSESAHRGGINRLEFAPDGSLLFSSSENETDRTLKVWEVASGRLLASAVLGENGPLAFAVHPQGKIVASAAKRRVVLHELSGGDVEVFRAQHPWKLQVCAFSASGDRLACSGEYRMPPHPPRHFFTVWETQSDKLLRLEVRGNHMDKPSWNQLALAFVPDNQALVAGGWGHFVQIFDRQDSFLPCKEPGLLAFDRSGKKLWVILDEETVQSWHWPDGKVASSWRHESLKFHGRNQLYCLAAGRQWLLAGGRDGQTHLLRTSDGKRHSSWPGPDVPIRSLAISADESWAAVGSQDGVVRFMSLPQGDLIATCQDHTDSVDGLALDPANKFLLTCSKENRVHIYSLQNGLPRLYVTLALPAGPVSGLCFHPQGKQFALIAGPETAVRVWNLDRLQQRLAVLVP